MADSTISDLSAFDPSTANRNNDFIPITDGSTSTQKITINQLAQTLHKLFAESSLSDGEWTGIAYPTSVQESPSVGDLMYWDDAATDGFKKALGDAEATMPAVAIALETGTGTSQKVMFWGVIKTSNYSGLTPGGMVYVSSGTSGALTQTVPSTGGDIVQPVGIALAADTIFFNPSMTLVEV